LLQAYCIIKMLRLSNRSTFFYSVRNLDCHLLSSCATHISDHELDESLSREGGLKKKFNFNSFDIYIPWDGVRGGLTRRLLNSSKRKNVNYIEEGSLAYSNDPFTHSKKKFLGRQVYSFPILRELFKIPRYQHYKSARFFHLGDDAFPFARDQQRTKICLKKYFDKYQASLQDNSLIILLPKRSNEKMLLDYIRFAKAKNPFLGGKVFIKFHPATENKIRGMKRSYFSEICTKNGVQVLPGSTILELELMKRKIALVGRSSLAIYARQFDRVVLDYHDF